MKSRSVFLYALFFLFFFQLLTDFVGCVYAFGLLGVSIPPEIAAVLLLFSPALLFFFPRPRRRLITTLFLVGLLARIVEPALDARWRMLVSGVGVAAWLMFFPLALRRLDGDDEGVGAMAWGLLLGVMTSALLRAFGSGVDISTMGWGQAIGVGLGLIMGWLWLREKPIAVAANKEKRAGFGRTLLLCLGLMAVVVLIYFAFAAPAVMARWTGQGYTAELVVLLTAWVGFALIVARGPEVLRISKTWLLIWNALFLVALYQTISGQQTVFPVDAGAYPLLAAPPAIWSGAVFYLMLLLSPIIFLDFYRLSDDLAASSPSVGQLAGGFTLASFFLLLAIFSHVFTTTYDYIPVVGPYFRDAFAAVYFLSGLMLFPGVLALNAPNATAGRVSKTLVSSIVALAVLIALGQLAVAAHPQPARPGDAITFLTYNIQQGYSASGRKNYGGQLAQIRAANPDIIGLEESDTARIANSNDDVVRYFADHLDMYSYYGPKTVDGTFGIAMLSRFPIQNATTFYLYSKGEQVAAIRAEVMWRGKPLTVFITHLGNGGPMIQQQQLLQLIGATPQSVAMGDFNFRPDSPQYQLTVRVMHDAWTQKWPDWRDDQGRRPVAKIDHIFITPDLISLDARYFPSGPSDHPAVSATIGR